MRDRLHSRAFEQRVKRSDRRTLAARGAIGKNDALFGPRECDEEPAHFFLGLRLERKPCAIIEPDEHHRVVFQSLAFVNGHQRNSVPDLVNVEGFAPRRGTSARGFEMKDDSRNDVVEPVPLPISRRRRHDTLVADKIEQGGDNSLSVRLRSHGGWARGGKIDR